jgi:hypothetical protein
MSSESRLPAFTSILLALVLLLPLQGLAQAPDTQPSAPIAWTQADADGQTTVNLWFFWSARCPHCLEARPEVLAMARAHPWIRLHDQELTRHPDNVADYVNMAAALGQTAQSVPAFIYCGRMEVGWDRAETSGRALLAALQACRDPNANDPSTMAQAGQPPEQIDLPWIGRVDAASALAAAC